jgi:flagellar basal-body rod protein FlgF
MDRLIYTAMTGAKHAFLQQAGVAQNLANASTTGYRAMEHKFRAVPIQGEGAPTRAFVVDASVADVFDQGPMMATGRPLDVAVRGAGWIAVEGSDGKEAYTRAGNLQTNANGLLQTAGGLNVVGDGGPLAVPPDNRVTIAPDGTVSTVPLFGVPNNVSVVGRIKLVNPPESELVRGADGLFRLKSGNPADTDETVKLASETLEGSNVNPVDAMVSMISLARQFEMQIKMLQTADTNASKASQILSMNA